MSLALFRLGRLEEALAAAREAVQLVPDDPDSWWVLGTVAVASEHNDEAMRAFQRLFELDPTYLDGHEDLRTIWENLQEVQEVQED